MMQSGTERGLPRSLILLVGMASAIVAVIGLRAAAEVAAPVMLAVVLTVAVLPVGRWALRRGWPGWMAAALTIASSYAILGLLIGGVALSVAQLAGTLPRYAPRASQLVGDLFDDLSRWGVDTSSVRTSLNELDLGTLIGLLQSVLSGVLHTLADLGFLAVLLFFMTADALGLAKRGEQLRAMKPGVAGALSEFARGTQRYLVVSAAFGAVVALLDVAALWALGVPLALTWGLLSFLTNFVPNIGFVLGVLPPAMLALLDQGWGTMVAVLVIYSVLNLVIQTFIQPRYVGDSVGLNGTTTFLALAFWGFVLGPLGALLAVPATLLVRAVFVGPDSEARWVMLIFGPGPRRDATSGERPLRPG
jgi:AI-2 transport protein TqsA